MVIRDAELDLESIAILPTRTSTYMASAREKIEFEHFRGLSHLQTSRSFQLHRIAAILVQSDLTVVGLTLIRRRRKGF